MATNLGSMVRSSPAGWSQTPFAGERPGVEHEEGRSEPLAGLAWAGGYDRAMRSQAPGPHAAGVPGQC